ncbi:hypothetical protein V8C44DRAFT_53591 [Trichoderma aethiopicum]
MLKRKRITCATTSLRILVLTSRMPIYYIRNMATGNVEQLLSCGRFLVTNVPLRCSAVEGNRDSTSPFTKPLDFYSQITCARLNPRGELTKLFSFHPRVRTHRTSATTTGLFPKPSRLPVSIGLPPKGQKDCRAWPQQMSPAELELLIGDRWWQTNAEVEKIDIGPGRRERAQASLDTDMAYLAAYRFGHLLRGSPRGRLPSAQAHG